MLLSAEEIVELIEQHVIENTNLDYIKIRPINYPNGVDLADVNAASLDLHLARDFLEEGVPSASNEIVHLGRRERPTMVKAEGEVYLAPHRFCLGATSEIFRLPDDVSGMFILKSSLARSGLEHSQAGWADAGWHDSALTLELSNLLSNHTLHLEAGMAIGQMIFFRHTKVPEEFLYSTKGRYNGDRTVQEIKP